VPLVGAAYQEFKSLERVAAPLNDDPAMVAALRLRRA
jgi:hypothetical protein